MEKPQPLHFGDFEDGSFHELDEYAYSFNGSWFEIVRMAQALRVVPMVLGGALNAPVYGYKQAEQVSVHEVRTGRVLIVQDVRRETAEETVTRINVRGDIETESMVILQEPRGQIIIGGDVHERSRVLVVGDYSRVLVYGDVHPGAVVLAVGENAEVAVLGAAMKDSTVETHGVGSRVAVAQAECESTIYAIHEVDGVSIGAEE